MKTPALALQGGTHRLRQYFQLTKPRVVSLIVFCAVIGMFLAVPGMVPWRILIAATAGIALVAGAAAAVNCLIEQKIGSMLGLGEGRPGVPLPAAMQRKISVGAILGGVVPGLGLAYSAPWRVVAIGTVAVIVGWKVLAFFSLMLAVPFLVVAAVTSAVLGGLYTWQYNNMGRRAALGEDPTMRKLQSKIKL